jgi:diaminopimelate decarboxylase
MHQLVKLLSFPMMRRSRQGQANNQLRDLTLWDLEVDSSGHISISGLDTTMLSKEFGSPLLVVNKDKLQKDAAEIKSALTTVAPVGSRVLYSYKTNCIPGILRELHDMQIGAEVISPYELCLAEKLGVPGAMIVYNGVNKTDESIERAARMKALSINVDSIEEIDRIFQVAKRVGTKIQVGVRLGLAPSSQFGLQLENGEALNACRKITSLADILDLVSIHFNVTSNARSASTHKACALRAAQFMADVKKETGLTIPYLDIGGGFGVPTSKNMNPMEYGFYRLLGCLPKAPSPDDFQSISTFLGDIITTVEEFFVSKDISMPKILIEPGRFITSRAEFLLATVLAVKEKANGTKFVITDAGRLSITFPTDFEYHEVFVANRPLDPLTTLYQVMGRICTSADWMYKNRLLPKLCPGDVLAVMDAGAYFSSYATNFSFPRPPIVMIDGGNVEIIRHGETFEHLTAMDKM